MPAYLKSVPKLPMLRDVQAGLFLLLADTQTDGDVCDLQDHDGGGEREGDRDAGEQRLLPYLRQARSRPARVDDEASERAREYYSEYAPDQVHADHVERVVVAETILHAHGKEAH